MGLFEERLKNANGKTQIPVWFMRQAGRYHDHYQNIKKNSDFMTMCKNPELACEVTMGPIDEFDFDAAILFSDLLFPLEQLNLGLNYLQGPPRLSTHLQTMEDLKKIEVTENSGIFYKFQKTACELLRNRLPQNKTLLGFVGAPFTLYTYAVEGSHSGNLVSSKIGFDDGRFQSFMEVLIPELVQEMSLQAQGGADAICLFDTAVGELDLSQFKEFALPTIKNVSQQFKKLHPDKKIVYYSKHTHLDYLNAIEDKNIDVLGIDWRVNLSQALNELGDRYYIQGNIDPVTLHRDWIHIQKKLDDTWNQLQKENVNFSKWICGLGHGVLQHTPKENVKKAVEYIHNNFHY